MVNIGKNYSLDWKNFRGLANFLKSSHLNNSNRKRSEQVLKSKYVHTILTCHCTWGFWHLINLLKQLKSVNIYQNEPLLKYIIARKLHAVKYELFMLIHFKSLK